ncbi:ATP-binding protein [Streptomyces sp. RY43-2]|uniref:ATP-binding protein n=1 Tax=Streptomyces macrolidinus TaxID=2952607 RepID=A0ABT0ZE72_9ACTN|nr:ATP-binding protein [Streptomyces macrolidinus]MCN9241883.1 ATP-binding protein [Streptomyces macrolidinus]
MASITSRQTGREDWLRPVASATGAPAYTGVIQRDEQAAEDARAMVALALAVWHLEQLAEDATLVVSELMSNAVRHGRGAVVRVTVTRTTSSRVRIAVTDRSRTLPQLQESDLLAEGGRGLRLVNALSSDWGVIRYGWGKRVWSEVSE